MVRFRAWDIFQEQIEYTVMVYALRQIENVAPVQIFREINQEIYRLVNK